MFVRKPAVFTKRYENTIKSETNSTVSCGHHINILKTLELRSLLLCSEHVVNVVIMAVWGGGATWE